MKASNGLAVIQNSPILRKRDKGGRLSAFHTLQNRLLNLLQVRQCVCARAVLINPFHIGCFFRRHLSNITKLTAALRADKMVRSRLSGVDKTKCNAAAVRAGPVNPHGWKRLFVSPIQGTADCTSNDGSRYNAQNHNHKYRY